MKNPHIIVGEPNRCICGMYDGKPVSCAEVIEANDRIASFCLGESGSELRSDDLKLVRAIIIPLIKDQGDTRL